MLHASRRSSLLRNRLIMKIRTFKWGSTNMGSAELRDQLGGSAKRSESKGSGWLKINFRFCRDSNKNSESPIFLHHKMMKRKWAVTRMKWGKEIRWESRLEYQKEMSSLLMNTPQIESFSMCTSIAARSAFVTLITCWCLHVVATTYVDSVSETWPRKPNVIDLLRSNVPTVSRQSSSSSMWIQMKKWSYTLIHHTS